MNKTEQTTLPCVDLSEKSIVKKELYPLGCFKNKPRPDYFSKEVKDDVLKNLLPKVLEWLEGEGESFYDDEDDEEETDEIDGVREQLADVLDYNQDGFGMAFELKDHHSWEPNDRLVDILGNIDFYSARQKAVLAWMRDNNVAPKLEIGAKVKICIVKKFKKCIMEDCLIVNVRADGNYVVSDICDEDAIKNKTGYVIPWEKVEEQNGR